MSFRPEATLNPRALRREAVQLCVVAGVCVAALVSGSHALRMVAGVVAGITFVLTTIAVIVAWRVGGRGGSLGVYVSGAVAFLVLTIASFA